MSNPWKTGGVPPAPKSVQWPTPAQWAKQMGLLVAIVLPWGGLMVAVLQLTAAGAYEATPPPTQIAASEVTATPTPAPPTETPSPPPTATSTPLPSPTVEATPPAETTPVVEPSPPATFTLTPPPATNTPEPPPSPPAEAAPPPPESAPAESAVSFAAEVLPIFEQRCVKCHGGEKTNEGLALTSYANVMAGSWNGPVIEPGNVAGSYLIELITAGKMPKKGPHLLPAQIKTITAWVLAGAPDN
jgi:mono/diheme cytochrome c family protein